MMSQSAQIPESDTTVKCAGTATVHATVDAGVFRACDVPEFADPGLEIALPPRRLRPLRFAMGLLLTTCGMGLILWIGLQMLTVQQLGGDFALVVVAVVVLSGVILLGGGFGLMATSASGFDESEFDRLIRAGNISAATMCYENTCDGVSDATAQH